MTHQAVDLNQSVDLTNCDREPIQIPGLIQPHGVLLVLQEPDLNVVQVSRNLFEWVGKHPQALLGKPLLSLLSPQQVKRIWECLNEDFESVNPLDISINFKEKLLHFDGIIHRCGNQVILELEPKITTQKSDFIKFYKQTKGVITQIQKAPSLLKMCEVVVKEVRKSTGFDRVMIYRFDAEGAGQVIACLTDKSFSINIYEVDVPTV